MSNSGDQGVNDTGTLSAADLLRELGLPGGSEPPPPGAYPVAGGRWVVPHFYGFSGLFNYATRVYRYTHDEAVRNSRVNALAMRRDPVLYDALRARQVPTTQLPWQLEPQDKADPAQLEAVEVLTGILKGVPKFQQFRRCLLEALWYGRAGVQVHYEWDYSSGSRRMVPVGWTPVNGDKLVFGWGGREGVLVHATWDGPKRVSERALTHFFTDSEREAYVIHEFEPEDADFFEPEMGGAVRGTGLRGRLYWFWLMKNTVFGLLLDYLQRTASGFTIYYYQAGNPKSFAEVKAAAQAQLGRNVVLFPRLNEAGDRGPGVERVEPSQAGAALFQSLIMNYFDSVMRRVVLGLTLTNELGQSEVGGDAAGAMREHASRVIKYDAIDLDETFNRDLVPVLARWNTPHVPPPRYVTNVDKPNVGEYMAAALQFFQMGGALDEDDLRGVLGLPVPEPGHAVLSQLNQLQPNLQGLAPEGVPVAGAQGPGRGEDPGAAGEPDPNVRGVE